MCIGEEMQIPHSLLAAAVEEAIKDKEYHNDYVFCSFADCSNRRL